MSNVIEFWKRLSTEEVDGVLYIIFYRQITRNGVLAIKFQYREKDCV
jgi:hypothetical protein